MTTRFFPWIGLTETDLQAHLKTILSDKRLAHVNSVAQTAQTLAERYGYPDLDKAYLTGLLHDYAKELPDEVFVELIARYHMDESLLVWGNNIWHGVVGVVKLTEDLGLTDPEVIEAIQVHTTGAPDMSLLAKILYVADYIEPLRDFPGVETARQLAYEHSLEAALAYEAQHTLVHLIATHHPVHPDSLRTYNAYVAYLED